MSSRNRDSTYGWNRGKVASMFRNSPFWRTTWRADAVQIWWTAGVSIIMAIVGVLEGWGMAISLLLALAALPLALATLILFQQRAHVAAYIRRHFGSETRRDEIAASAFMEARDGDEHETIELFIIETLQPACFAQVDLQEAILEVMGGNPKIMEYAKRGLISHYWNSDFARSYETLVEFGGSPMPNLTNGEMIKFINTLEGGAYREFCEQAEQLGETAGFDHRIHPITGPLWEEWREKHNELVSAYDDLKRKSRLKGLYRPQRSSRWGESEPPLVTDR